MNAPIITSCDTRSMKCSRCDNTIPRYAKCLRIPSGRVYRDIPQAHNVCNTCGIKWIKEQRAELKELLVTIMSEEENIILEPA